MWYYKGLAECAIENVEECAKSCVHASSLGGDKYKGSVERLEMFVKLLRVDETDYYH